MCNINCVFLIEKIFLIKIVCYSEMSETYKSQTTIFVSLHLKDAIDQGTIIEFAVDRTCYRCYLTDIAVFVEILRNSGAQNSLI